ncbi:conserved hypothetical protein [Candidatus Sulfopaludibacter sp. SbA4]|nr:conserved hypothetical protein [Candidatus Sulfopaludibacter sp. SbA4]
MAPCTQAAGVVHHRLIQIHSGFRTAWCDLSLSVETGAEGWTAKVDRGGRALYTAQRSSLQAAKNAAVEFVLFGVAGATCWESPERIAGRLRWSEYW